MPPEVIVIGASWLGKCQEKMREVSEHGVAVVTLEECYRANQSSCLRVEVNHLDNTV